MRIACVKIQIYLFSMAVCFSMLRCDNTQVSPQGSPKPAESKFERLRRQYSHSGDTSQNAVEKHNRISAILDAAILEPWAKNENVSWTIIMTYPNDPLSQDLMDRELEALPSEKIAEREAFLDKILRAVPDSAIAAKALHVQLKNLQNTSADAFLGRCESVIEHSASPRLTRVALYNRIQYYYSSDEWRKSALDALVMWAEFPDFVSDQRLRPRYAGTLRLAGLLLEANMLERCESPEIVAAELIRRFGADSPGGAAVHEEAYLRSAPELGLIDNIPRSEFPSHVESVWHHARLTSLALKARDYHSAILNASLVAQGAELHHKEPVGTAQAEATMREVLNATLWDLIQPFEKRTTTAFSVGVSDFRKDAIRVCRRLCFAGFWLFEKSTPNNKVSHEGSLKVASRYAEALSKLSDHGGVTEFYESIAVKEGYESLAPELFMRSALYYEKSIQSIHEAANAYERIHIDYPDSPEAGKAILKDAQMRLKLDRHTECYGLLQQFLVKYRGDSRVPTARYLAAICEVELGLEAQGRLHMREVVDLFPTSRAAPNALYWLGTYDLRHQNYDEARLALSDLVVRYPEYQWRGEAQSLLARLESLETDTR